MSLIAKNGDDLVKADLLLLTTNLTITSLSNHLFC